MQINCLFAVFSGWSYLIIITARGAITRTDHELLNKPLKADRKNVAGNCMKILLISN